MNYAVELTRPRPSRDELRAGRRARNEAESVLVLQDEAHEAWQAFLQQEAGFFGRWMRRIIAR